MSKTILFASLAIAGTLILTDNANAGWRRNCHCAASPNYVYTYGSTNSTAAPTVAANAPATGSNYQSFSYEPGTAQPAQASAVMTPTYQAPVYYSRPGWSEFDSVLRGSRKVTGQ